MQVIICNLNPKEILISWASLGVTVRLRRESFLQGEDRTEYFVPSLLRKQGKKRVLFLSQIASITAEVLIESLKGCVLDGLYPEDIYGAVECVMEHVHNVRGLEPFYLSEENRLEVEELWEQE